MNVNSNHNSPISDVHTTITIIIAIIDTAFNHLFTRPLSRIKSKPHHNSEKNGGTNMNLRSTVNYFTYNINCEGKSVVRLATRYIL
jgi:hypothetical protein